MIELIIFDWDDVFTIGSSEGYYRCYHQALIDVGVHLTPSQEKERIASKWGSTQEEELLALLKERPELLPGAVKAYESHLLANTFTDCLSIVPGSQDMLMQLAKSYRLAIATGLHPGLLQTRIMPLFNIPEVFSQIESVYGLDDPTLAKPDPHMVNKIMDQQDITPDKTIMVGDAANDVRMAKAAGIKSVVVLTGHLNHIEAGELDADYIIDRVTQLPKVLSQL